MSLNRSNGDVSSRNRVKTKGNKSYNSSQCPPNDGTSLQSFMVLTVVTVFTSAFAYALISRIAWDVGELIFPEADYPYSYQSIFSMVLLSIAFLIFLIILFKVYRKHGIKSKMSY